MQLTPRYGADPLITLDGPPNAIAAPAIRQRRRLAALLAEFTPEQWAHPSRCAGWSNQDVIVHLESTNGFWTYAITMGLRGEPSRVLASFDPVATPVALVDAAGPLSPNEVLARFTASNDAFIAALEGLDDPGWTALAEAPPGHLTVAALAHHALWDSWIHERDILLPLGIEPEVEPDEVAASLRYAAALAPAFAVAMGTAHDRTGTLAVAATDPEVAFQVEAGTHVAVRTLPPADVEPGEGGSGGTGGSEGTGGSDGNGGSGGSDSGTPASATPADLTLSGEAIDLLEALSIRQPLTQPIPADSAWLVAGLAEVFDTPRT